MFNIPNILTGFNLLCGVTSIMIVFTGRLDLAVLLIFMGAIFDFFDGMVARLLKQSNHLGKQLDSLADIVTFGVAPGMIVFVLLILSGVIEVIVSSEMGIAQLWKEETMAASINFWVQSYFNQLVDLQKTGYQNNFFSTWGLVLPFGAFLIPFFSLFRLAKFNVDDRQTDSFIGLPTPANSIFFASFALLLWDGYNAENWKTSLSLILLKDQVLMTLVIIFSLLLVSEIKLFSLKLKKLALKGNELQLFFLGASLMLLLILNVWAIPLIIIIYIILSILVNTSNKT